MRCRLTLAKRFAKCAGDSVRLCNCILQPFWGQQCICKCNRNSHFDIVLSAFSDNLINYGSNAISATYWLREHYCVCGRFF